MWALIVSGEVRELFEHKPELHSDLMVVEVDPTVQLGDRQDVTAAKGFRPRRFDDDFASLSALHSYAPQWLTNASTALVAPLTSKYSPIEVVAFEPSLRAAKAYLAGTADAGEAALIELEGGKTAKPAEGVAQRIIAKATVYQKAIGEMKGFRGRVEEMLATFARGADETDEAAKARLGERLEAERASAEAAVGLLLAGGA